MIQDNLWSCLRADWMKVYDLTFVEDDLIAGIEQFMPNVAILNSQLQGNAQEIAAAQAAKEEAKKAGTAGVTQVQAKALTKPVGPNLTKQRLPRLPEVEKVEQNVCIRIDLYICTSIVIFPCPYVGKSEPSAYKS